MYSKIRIILLDDDPLVWGGPNCEYSCCVVPSYFILSLNLNGDGKGLLGLERVGSGAISVFWKNKLTVLREGPNSRKPLIYKFNCCIFINKYM